MTILLLADHDNKALSEQTIKAMSAAVEIGGEIDVLVAGCACAGVAEAAAKLTGARKVLLADDALYANQMAEATTDLILSVANGYDTLVSAATTTGKNIMPRVAALLDVMQISEIIAVRSADTFERPIYAGNAVQVVTSHEAKKVITVRTAAFGAAGNEGSASIEAIAAAGDPALASFVSDAISESDRPDLTSAKIIISGGRAMGSEEQFMTALTPLADKLGAALGASRAAVDAGFAPNDWQVGQTGKVVAPDLYIACGISGAIQHLAGMKDSKIIVAINKDEEAPIFQVADYGIVADLFEVLPQLEQAV